MAPWNDSTATAVEHHNKSLIQTGVNFLMNAKAVLLTALPVVLLAACGQNQPPESAPAPAPETAAASEPATPPHPAPAAADDTVDVSGIERADGGQTVAEVYAGKDEFEGEPVLIRGKIVKVNAGIMGKNWLHLRDGSGGEGTNDLTVTTVDILPAVGDTVVVSGPLSLDREFGMGYTYPLIIEDAEVTIEASGAP